MYGCQITAQMWTFVEIRMMHKLNVWWWYLILVSCQQRKTSYIWLPIAFSFSVAKHIECHPDFQGNQHMSNYTSQPNEHKDLAFGTNSSSFWPIFHLRQSTTAIHIGTIDSEWESVSDHSRFSSLRSSKVSGRRWFPVKVMAIDVGQCDLKSKEQ